MSFKPIAAAISFSLALFLLLFMVWPEYQELQDVNQQIDQAESRLERSKEYVSELETLSDRLKERNEAVSKIDSSLPSRPGVPSLLNFLYNTGTDQALLLKSVGAISRSSYKENIDRVSIDLVMVGSYSAFKKFVKAVEKSSRIIEVQQVSFHMPEDTEVNEPPQFDMTLVTHLHNSQ